LAEGSYSKGSELTDGYPEFTYGVLKKLGWDKDLTEAELATINKIGGNNPDGVGWAVDLSGGIIRVTLEHGVMAYGNGKARAVAWKPGPTAGSPNCSRTCSSRSTPRMPASAASRMAAGSGCSVRKTDPRPASRRWSPTVSARAWRSCHSTSRAGSRVSISATNIR